MQIKRVFAYKQRKKDYIYRKTIKLIRFSIYTILKTNKKPLIQSMFMPKQKK